MTFDLPQELIEEILDRLGGDFRALRTCSLVCSAWVPRCNLFKSVTLHTLAMGDTSNVLSFRDLLQSPCCTFLRHVRSFHSLRRFGDPDDCHFEQISTDLRRLSGVVELKMSAHIDGDATADSFFTTGFFRSFPQVTHLVLDYILLREQPMPVINLICLFPALPKLRVLYFTGIWADPPVSAFPPRSLRIVLLDWSLACGRILAWLLTFNHLPNVESLRLHFLKPADVPTVRAAMKQIGGALRHLEIKHSEGVFDFSLHPKLQTLAIHTWDLGLDELLILIHSLAGLPLQRLSLNVDRTLLRIFNWTPVDVFLSPPRFPLLRTVRFVCSLHDDPEFLRRALPLLEASGRLQSEQDPLIML
ncbi:hypothetical protein DFH08DRAFT_370016 [Mycena albidolilacea]|uniref:F-box domain-containing protein n=1 Tax=Mycena albidolilacea TaxID=1033008 RepID=A0AAD7AK81_9AGAR|nr:hypothetical protein DFH08DRAFT_370016 [Mycena albidolilacea]